ncbi:hypothetical protein QJS04_geneDACA007762 [Acorus gramineus]|uniref:Uncharacterized protein n=1 Tax=Acorus gramineus TaxID=55184 RepID=A0AAV9B2E0_ACOGR|nr:hypothetical protein QJS04_geneDACA007762 [Acorus gramineus]
MEVETTDLRLALTETTRRGGESTGNKIGNGVVEPSIAFLSNSRSTSITPLSHNFLSRETAHHHPSTPSSPLPSPLPASPPSTSTASEV